MARINDGLLKNWLDGSVVKAAEYKQEREILRTAINDNDARITTNTNNATALTERVSDLETDNTENKSDITSLEGRMNSVEEANSDQDTQLSSLDARMTGVESTNTSQSNEISAIGTRVSTLEGTTNTNGGRISSVESGVSSLNTRMTNAETKNTEQDNRINNIVGNVGSSNTEIVDARLGSDGTTHAVLKNRLDKMENNLIDKDRISQTLLHGVSIFSSALNSPVEFEIQGRTLTSLGNSNLEGNKNYVLADKRTKIRAEGKEGTLISGVAKFVKSASVLTKADLVGKVSGSVVENGHVAKEWDFTSLIPISTWNGRGDLSQADYNNIQVLNGTSNTYSWTGVGSITQQLFSFNIIEQIERKLGRIPSDTVAGKVQWIKDNVNKLTANWHGWGSSVGGNGVSFTCWHSNSTWDTPLTHTSGTVTKITYAHSGVNIRVDNNGFAHFLAYTTNPSDGVTPSQLNTDFIELEIELKTTAVLDTRPILTRVANFEGKVSGDLTSNPHVAKHSVNQSTLQTPLSVNWIDQSQGGYDQLAKLDGSLQGRVTALTSGLYAQQLFSFDLIQEIERNLGRIPKATLADKVQWVKDNVQSLACEWTGFGSSVGGNGATLKVWNNSLNSWDWGTGHTNGTPTKITHNYLTNYANFIDVNGFIHWITYAPASDGVTASTINTDYISLDITLKQGATLFDPILPLYEVDATEYANILTTWDEPNVLNRYPRVQGVQHLQNVAVIAEGENLIPNFYENGATLHANAKINTPYEIELNATATLQPTRVVVPCKSNTVYTLSAIHNGWITVNDGANTVVLGANTQNQQLTFNSGNYTSLMIQFSNHTSGVGKFTFTNPMLTLGNTAKPFVPRNPSYLFAPVKLGQIGDKKDSLFTQDGAWYVRKQVEKDVVLDGSLAWSMQTDFTGHKQVRIPMSSALMTYGNANGEVLVTDYATQKYKHYYTDGANAGANRITLEGGYLYAMVSDTKTGFGESFTPSASDIQRYFNGWKYTDGTTWQSVTGNGQTATASVALSTKPTDYTPYKLSYVLATPQLLNVNNVVEGAISVSGQTQVEVTSGVVVREKVTPFFDGGTKYHINFATFTSSKLKQKLDKFVAIYKNGTLDKAWAIVTDSNGNGKQRALIESVSYDTNATYEVTYLVLDRHLQTNNATEVKASYSGSLKDTVDMNTEQLTDLKTQTSINTNLIYRLLVQAKGAGWNV